MGNDMAGPWHSTSISTERLDPSQLDIKEILFLILMELKKLNLHIQSITDEEI